MVIKLITINSVVKLVARANICKVNTLKKYAFVRRPSSLTARTFKFRRQISYLYVIHALVHIYIYIYIYPCIEV